MGRGVSQEIHARRHRQRPAAGGEPRDFSWTGNHDEIGAFWRGFETLWLPASLLQADQQNRIADALFAATRHWVGLEIQFEKGLAGAPDDTIAAARDTATNPAVLTAFGLALIGSFGPPAYLGIPGFAPDLIEARRGDDGWQRDEGAAQDRAGAGLLCLGEQLF